jgi:signal transduction histidine kinase
MGEGIRSEYTQGETLPQRALRGTRHRGTDAANGVVSVAETLGLYRYLSLGLTCVFYLGTYSASPLWLNALTVLVLLVEARVAQHLYVTRTEVRFRVRLVGVETIAIAMLLIPTGGLYSPFWWYGFNPILAAALYLPLGYAWITVAIYFGLGVGGLFLERESLPWMLAAVKDRAWILLAFCLMTAIAQLYSRLIAQMSQALALAIEAQGLAERSLHHLASVHRALEQFSSQDDAGQIAELLAREAVELCGSSQAGCAIDTTRVNQEGTIVLAVHRRSDSPPDIDWQKVLGGPSCWQSRNACTVSLMKEKEGTVACCEVKSGGEIFGCLGLWTPSESSVTPETLRWLNFLADVGGLVLERIKADVLWSRLLVTDEQQRIAAEIHDGVAQQLFSIVCGLEALEQHPSVLTDPVIAGHLDILKRTAGDAARELRLSIYGISPFRRGAQPFVDSLAAYLDDIGRLNGVQVEMESEGSEEVLSPALRVAFHRICREACGNAMRHGQCSWLKVTVKMSAAESILEVRDNGRWKGPEARDIARESRGMGIRNMTLLAERFNGELEILTERERGTVVRCVVPRRKTHGSSLSGSEACESGAHR